MSSWGRKTILSEPVKEIKEEQQVATPGPSVSEMKRAVPETAPETTDEVETQIRALKDENSGIRAEACDALGELQDPRAVDPLIQALQDKDYMSGQMQQMPWERSMTSGL